MKRYFFGYGWLSPISEDEYLTDVARWMYDDSDPEDGTIICVNTITGEYRYVREDDSNVFSH